MVCYQIILVNSTSHSGALHQGLYCNPRIISDVCGMLRNYFGRKSDVNGNLTHVFP